MESTEGRDVLERRSILLQLQDKQTVAKMLDVTMPVLHVSQRNKSSSSRAVRVSRFL